MLTGSFRRRRSMQNGFCLFYLPGFSFVVIFQTEGELLSANAASPSLTFDGSWTYVWKTLEARPIYSKDNL
nr:hypothetical protein [Tanacetum cinerariifolium]